MPLGGANTWPISNRATSSACRSALNLTAFSKPGSSSVRKMDSDWSSGFSTSTAAGSRPARSRSPGARKVVVQASSKPAPARISRSRRTVPLAGRQPARSARRPGRHGALDAAVAPHAGDLLDDVDLPFAVEPPAGDADRVDARLHRA